MCIDDLLVLGNAYTVKGKEMLLAPENKETKDQNTENSKIEDNNTENEEELNKGAKKEDTSMQIGAPSALLMEASTGTVLFEQEYGYQTSTCKCYENYDNASYF